MKVATPPVNVPVPSKVPLSKAHGPGGRLRGPAPRRHGGSEGDRLARRGRIGGGGQGGGARRCADRDADGVLDPEAGLVKGENLGVGKDLAKYRDFVLGGIPKRTPQQLSRPTYNVEVLAERRPAPMFAEMTTAPSKYTLARPTECCRSSNRTGARPPRCRRGCRSHQSGDNCHRYRGRTRPRPDCPRGGE